MMSKVKYYCRAIMPLMAMLLATQLWAQPFASHSQLASGNWFKIAVNTTGVYKLTTADIPSLNNAHCDQIALYGAPGGQLSVHNSDAHFDDLVPAAIQIADANNNGIFENGDYLLFYGEAPGVWRYSNAEQRFEYTPHAYANYNYYYITTDNTSATSELRVQPYPHTSANQGDIRTYTGIAMIHEDKTNVNGGGQIWMSDKFTSSLRDRSYKLTLPGTPQSSSLLVRYAMSSNSSYNSKYLITSGSTTREHLFYQGETYKAILEQFPAGNNKEIDLTCSFVPYESSAVGYLDFIEINCLVPLAYSGSQTFFRNVQQLGEGNVSRFVCNGNSNGVMIWDVTHPSQPVALDITPGNGNFAFLASTAEAGTYIAFTASSAEKPASIASIDNQDIHGEPVPDYVIVSHHDFLDQAERLADLHRIQEGMSVLVVTQEQVFNEFSSGRPDPIAIRQMLRHFRSKGASSNTTPRYLLLFGKGTFDNRDINNLGLKTVITYESSVSFGDEARTYASDDFVGFLDDDEGDEGSTLDISIGRLPAKNEAEAAHMVNKIERYMAKNDLLDNAVRGDWRNYVCLLADDADPSCPGDKEFAESSEITADTLKVLYPTFNIDRIYADSYVQQSGADGSYYPDVNNALRKRLNYGCLLLNYIGHGSYNYIGTERYMEFNDIDQYTNNDRLAFFVTSTCSFGHYDLVDGICGAEKFLLADAAGIGVVAASRPISHIQRFNTDVCIHALNTENTIGDALRIAKNKTYTSPAIALFGDPALRLSVPQNSVVVTHINGQPVDADRTDSIEVLSHVTIEGEIRNAQGALMDNFDGEIYPIVFDRETQCRTLANDNEETEVDFVQQKNILFKGREKVEKGRFSYSFIIPRDVSYQYGYAKLSHYARNDHDDAAGQYSNLMFGGFNESTVISELHPHIDLFINDTNFRDGGLTNESPTLYARLKDSIGINAAGSGLGHDITVTLDGNPYSTVTLNDFFETDINDSRNGEVRYTLEKLDNGPHTLTLKCWNIFNYSSSADIRFVVANDRQEQIGQVFSTPNPAHDRTTIRIEHNLPSAIQSATLEIFDIWGCCLLSTDLTPAEGSYVLAYNWDFTAPARGLVTKGIYIARAIITTTDGQQLQQICKIIKN